ncbi:hypothetical protein [Nocardia sp. alder85J]|nr:hypothetical protein [Nocardia sp. alder85J]MCX4095805.1 hypothetical protein [Nocardia sp. alder85J]
MAAATTRATRPTALPICLAVSARPEAIPCSVEVTPDAAATNMVA